MSRRTTGWTRRQIAATLTAASPLVAQVATQTPASAVPASPAAELEAARAQAKQMSAQIRRTRVPMLLEPGFIFRP